MGSGLEGRVWTPVPSNVRAYPWAAFRGLRAALPLHVEGLSLVTLCRRAGDGLCVSSGLKARENTSLGKSKRETWQTPTV